MSGTHHRKSTNARLSLQVLQEEPPCGHLRSGERVLVDDGSCSPGYIKLVTGGSNRIYETDTKIEGKPRQRVCVPR